MFTYPLTLAAAALLLASGTHAQATDDLATGKHAFRCQGPCTPNAEGMIAKDEFMKYG